MLVSGARLAYARRNMLDCWVTALATMYERLYWMDMGCGRYLACNFLPLPPLVSRQRAQADAWQRRWRFVRQNFGLVSPFRPRCITHAAKPATKDDLPAAITSQAACSVYAPALQGGS